MTQAVTTRKMTTTDLAVCGLFVALIVIGAYIKIMIPIGPFAVTFSLQFLFSLMAGLLMGPKRGGATLATYLILGLIGLPVFAHGGGLGYILRPTFGFLIGFLGAAIVSGFVKKRLHSNKVIAYLIAAFLGEIIYYLCGLIYYYIFFNYVITDGGVIGVNELLVVWCFSTFIPDFGLAVLAALLSTRLAPHMPMNMRREMRMMEGAGESFSADEPAVAAAPAVADVPDTADEPAANPTATNEPAAALSADMISEKAGEKAGGAKDTAMENQRSEDADSAER